MLIKIKGAEVIKHFEDGYYKVNNTFYCIKNNVIYQIYFGTIYKNFVCEGDEFNEEPLKIEEREWLDAVSNILSTIQLTLPEGCEIKPSYVLTLKGTNNVEL